VLAASNHSWGSPTHRGNAIGVAVPTPVRVRIVPLLCSATTSSTASSTIQLTLPVRSVDATDQPGPVEAPAGHAHPTQLRASVGRVLGAEKPAAGWVRSGVEHVRILLALLRQDALHLIVAGGELIVRLFERNGLCGRQGPILGPAALSNGVHCLNEVPDPAHHLRARLHRLEPRHTKVLQSGIAEGASRAQCVPKTLTIGHDVHHILVGETTGHQRLGGIGHRFEIVSEPRSELLDPHGAIVAEGAIDGVREPEDRRQVGLVAGDGFPLNAGIIEGVVRTVLELGRRNSAAEDVSGIVPVPPSVGDIGNHLLGGFTTGSASLFLRLVLFVGSVCGSRGHSDEGVHD
jgi:hypothetical protein